MASKRKRSSRSSRRSSRAGRKKHGNQQPATIVEIVTFDGAGNAVDNVVWRSGDDVDDFVRMNVDDDARQEVRLIDAGGTVIESARVEDEDQAAAWIKRRAKRKKR